MPDNQQTTVSLGCGTLILIALIVLIFSQGASDDVRREIQMLRQEVQSLTQSIKALEAELKDRDPSTPPAPAPAAPPPPAPQ
jgi:cell division protein FtsB